MVSAEKILAGQAGKDLLYMPSRYLLLLREVSMGQAARTLHTL